MSKFLDDRILRVLKIFASTKFIVGELHKVSGSPLVVDTEGMYYNDGTQLITVLEIVPHYRIMMRTLANQIVYVQPMGEVQDVLLYDAQQYITSYKGKIKSIDYKSYEYFEEDDLFNLSTQGFEIPVLSGLGYLSFIRSEFKYAGAQFNYSLLLEVIEKYPSVLDEWELNENT